MMAEPKVRLNAEDKKLFSTEVAKLGPVELLQVIEELRFFQGRFTKADWRFMQSHIGQRCYKLLRNVVLNQSWEDDPAGKESPDA